MEIFKIGGLLLVFSASSLLGFYKSNQLIKRSKALNEVCISLEKLAGLIKCGTADLHKLLNLCFDNNVQKTPKGYTLKDETLGKEDKRLFEKMTTQMGVSNKESEIKNVLLYNTLFQKRLKEAEDKAEHLAKLYTSLGPLIGASICIFLI
jgi:hypothetical protein